MTTRVTLPLLFVWISSLGSIFAETPPPNDDFANATLVTGDLFSATSEVHCATIAPDEPPFKRYPLPSSAAFLDSLTGRTVWWKWQAPAGPDSSAFQLILTSSAPPSNNYVPHVEVFEATGANLVSHHLNYIGIDQPFLIRPNKTYYFRGFYSADPGKTQPDTVTLTLAGSRHDLAPNRGIENSIPLSGSTIPQLYSRPYTNLFFTWTPDTTGFVELKDGAPFSARVNVYPEGEAFERLDGPVIAGETYSLSFYTTSTTRNPVLIGGELEFLTPAENSSFDGSQPVLATPYPDRTELKLMASGHGREFWWSYTPSVDGLLKTTASTSPTVFEVTVLEENDLDSTLGNLRSTTTLTANTTYYISLRNHTGQVVNGTEQSFTFYPTHDPVNVTDPELSKALRLAFNLPNDAPIPAAFLTDLSTLRVRAFRDCDDDDCSSIPGFTITGLEGLERAENLESLYFQGGEYAGHSISGLSPIKGLTKLKTLRLPNALKGTEAEMQAAMEDLSEMTGLEWLSLEQNNLTNANLEPLATLTRLETLDIDDNRVSDLTPIAGLTLIRKLDIDDNPVTDLSPLSSLQKIRDLDLNPIQNGLSSLPPLRNIRTIKVIADDLGPLARLTNLNELILPANSKLPTPPRLRDLTPIANLPNLWSISNNLHSSAVRDFRPLSLINYQHPAGLSHHLSNLVHNSKAAVSDPLNADLFTIAELNPNTIPRTPDDPALMIPDGKLRWYMNKRRRGGSPSDPTPEELATLTFLSGDLVESLEGIELAPNLRTLNLFNGWITDLTPLSGLDQLTTLSLSNNFIHDLTPISHFTGVRIDLRGNPINPETIPAGWLEDPNIQIDPPTTLDAAEDIPDPNLRSLIRIALGKRPDELLVSDDLVNLRTLHADYGNIRSLEGLEAAVNLTGLSLRNNILTDLAPIPTGKLRWLRVSGNPLDQPSEALLDSMEVEGIIIDNSNETRFLSAITPSNGVVFADDYQLPLVRYLRLFPEVTTLFLSYNYLDRIPELTDLPNLETVYLEGNLLLLGEQEEARVIIDDLRTRGVVVHTAPQRPEISGEIEIGQSEMRIAIADGLNLPFVPPAVSLVQLESIEFFDWERSAGKTPIEDPSLISKMTNVEFLSLEEAGISDLTFLENLNKLQWLDLDFNSVIDLSPIRNMNSLRELDLNNNQISDISVIANFPDLVSLDIDNNSISSIQPIGGLAKLAELDIRLNRIDDITPVNGLGMLAWIDIRLNGIDYSKPSQASSFADLKSRIDYPYLYPQFEVSPQITINGTRVRLDWMGEQQTYYQILFTPRLDEPFLNYRFSSTSLGAGPIQMEFDTGQRKGFFKIIPLPNPY